MRCFICDEDGPTELHHPIPRRAGGEAMGTVPLCEGCHTAVDRIPIDRWDPVEALGALARAWPALDVGARRMLLKMIALTADAHRMLSVGCSAAHMATKKGKRGKAPPPVERVECGPCAASQV